MDANKLIENNKKKYNSLYSTGSGVAVTAEWDSGVWFNQVDSRKNRESEFIVQKAIYERNLEAVKQGFDNVPVTYFDFGRTAWLMAIAYGCEIIETNGLINAKYLYHNIEDIADFEKIEKPWERGLYPEIIDRLESFGKMYPHIPITISDNQSPNDVLTSMLNSEEAMIGMFSEPGYIHNMTDKITQSIIEINRHFEKVITNFAGFQCAWYLPFGMHISDDNAAFLSPDTYKEFSKPYNEKLAEEFGGIAYHCCMGQEQNIENMVQTQGFIGLDTMPDFNDPNKVIKAFEGGKGVWNIYNYSYAIRQEKHEGISDVDWFKKLIDKVDGRFGLLLNVYNPNREESFKMADAVKNYAEKRL